MQNSRSIMSSEYYDNFNENLILSKNSLNNDKKNGSIDEKIQYKLEYVWIRIILLSLVHIGAIHGFYVTFFQNCWKLNIFYGVPLGIITSLSITGGAHRLWTHKSYKASWQLRLILMFFQTMAYQNSILEWSRDHRAHHKFTDTDADPHNSRRGFFFCHMGWLLVKKHPDVKRKGQSIDMSDLKEDKIVMFQEKYFWILMPLIAFIMPALIPYYFWNYTLLQSFTLGSCARYVCTLHLTWTINSFAHLWGMKPFDKNISSCDNSIVIGLTIGEGYHNYHHIFPWDYKCSEVGTVFNLTKTVIDLFGKIGWAYDFKTVPEEVIRKRVLRTGDGSHEFSAKFKNMKFNDLIKGLDHDHTTDMLWAWEDPDRPSKTDKDCVINKKVC